MKKKDVYHCKKCGNKTDYHEIYDTYYCVSCNSWNEDKCKDPGCEFCMNRPDFPNEQVLLEI